MESYIDIQYITNLINLGYPSKYSIDKFEIVKAKVVLLLSKNDLILIDSKRNNQLAQRHFMEKVSYIKVYKDNLFISHGSTISLINLDTIEEQISYSIGEELYLFAFCDNKANMKGMELIYVNSLNEIKYYSKGLIESQYKKLYKENTPIDSLIYQKGILLWSTHETVRVFQLDKKQMLLKKTFNESTKRIECSLFNSILCVNVNRTDLYAYQLPLDEDKSTISYELIHIKADNKADSILGMWINSSLNKMSVLFHEANIILKIYRMDQVGKSSSSNDIIFTKSFQFISSPTPFHFYFSAHSSFVYIYNANEIFYVTLLEKSQKMFSDIQSEASPYANDSSQAIDIIYETFSSFSLNEKQYALCKLIRRRRAMKEFNDKKFFYLVDSLYNCDSASKSKVSHGLMVKMFNYFIMSLIQIKEIDFCFFSIKDKFNAYLTQATKEAIVKYLLKAVSFNNLQLFIKEINSLEITRKIEEIFLEEENNKERAIYANATIQRKNAHFVQAIDLLVSIKRSDEIYQILSENNQELLFQFDSLFELLDELHLLNLLDSLYFKDNSSCLVFFDKLFRLCSKAKTARVSLALIGHDKYNLIPNVSTAEELFAVILINSEASTNYSAFLLKFIRKYETFDYAKLIESNKKAFSELRNAELLIALLTLTKDYKEIINIYIDKLKDPEKCIKYIENNNIEDIAKEDIYAYLTAQIKGSQTLSVTKKFYFICQFQDNISLKDNGDIDLVKELNSSDEDDFDFLFLIIEQLKLKVKILEISGSISKNTVKEMMSRLKREQKEGKLVNFGQLFVCSCNSCESKGFNNEDTVICFQKCMHVFHKDCLYDKREGCPNCARMP